MTVALPIQFKIALVIATGGQAALRDWQGGHDLITRTRILNANHPRLTSRLWPEKAHVASQIHVAMGHTFFFENLCCTIGSILFAKAAQVYW